MMQRINGAGRFALDTFLLGASVSTPMFIGRVLPDVLHNLYTYIYMPLIVIWLTAVQYHIYNKYARRMQLYQIALRATFLGQAFGCGLIWSFEAKPSWLPFGNYMCVLSCFHFSEFITTAVIKPRNLKLDSFLLNHSKEYGIAAVASWLEFFLELYFMSSLKELRWIRYLGLIFCVGGEVMRKSAMLTAGSNFNHIVQQRHEEGHTLVTSGVYAICRHPSYVGWFYWSIGTQLVLVNPLCVVAYAMASWSFFKARVEEEELTLLNFFGQEYVDYMNRVPTGLPFINGISPDEYQ